MKTGTGSQSDAFSLVAIGAVFLAVFMVSIYDGGSLQTSLSGEDGLENIYGEAFRRPMGASILDNPKQFNKFDEQATKYALRTGDCTACFTLQCTVQCMGYSYDEQKIFNLKPAGSDGYKLIFRNKAGQTISHEIFGWTSSRGVFLGKVQGSTARDLVTGPNEQIDDEDYFVATDGSFRGFGRFLQYKGTQTSDDVYRIRDVGSGETYEVSYDSNGIGTLVIDGFTCTLEGQGDTSPYIYASCANNNIYTWDGASIRFFEEHLFLMPAGALPPLAVFVAWDGARGQLNIDKVFNPKLWELPYGPPAYTIYLGMSSETGFALQYWDGDALQSKIDLYNLEG